MALAKLFTIVIQKLDLVIAMVKVLLLLWEFLCLANFQSHTLSQTDILVLDVLGLRGLKLERLILHLDILFIYRKGSIGWLALKMLSEHWMGSDFPECQSLILVNLEHS